MNLSELEGCVLGLICRAEPCTAYFVRKEFGASLTTNWRASAGAIYPLIARLARSGLVSEEDVAGDARRARLLRPTAKGRAALAAWIAARPDGFADATADPIRTRFQFAQAAGAPAAAQFASWRTDTQAALARLEARMAEDREMDNALEVSAHRGAQLQLAARLQWLDELIAGLKHLDA